eukprot:TRINITY_DN21514_c0_g5_i2.p1 TRINITY_DN21514_c0_g5~~TRINITY_DN21514_c0_g5_i2.p1  ORF type:complete len:1391 (-),score=224.97 TRINITY_DN21514_c0_g5_i2:203-4252(-)
MYLLKAVDGLPDTGDTLRGHREVLQAAFETGDPISRECLDQFKVWMSPIVDWLGDDDVKQFQNAVFLCMTAGLSQFADLFTCLEEAVEKAIAGGRSLEKSSKANDSSSCEVVATNCVDELMLLGKHLVVCLDTVPALKQELGPDAQQAVLQMRDEGKPVTEQVLQQFQAHMKSVVSVLDTASVELMQGAARRIAGSGLSYFEPFGKTLAAAVVEAMGAGQEVIKLAANNAADVSAAAVAAVQEELKQVARILIKSFEGIPGFAEAAGAEVKEALQSMHVLGVPIAASIVEKLQPWVGAVVDFLGGVDLENLQTGIQKIARAGIDGFRDLAEWFSTAVETAVIACRVVADTAAPGASKLAAAAAAALQEEMGRVGGLLLKAFEGLPDFAEAAGEELKKALQNMASSGVPIASCLLAKFKDWVSAVIDFLCDAELEDLQRGVRSIAIAGIDGFRDLADWFAPAIESAIAAGRGVANELGPRAWAQAANAARAARDAFSADGFQDVLREGFGVLDEAYTMSSTALDEAMKVVQGIPADGCGACIPLLRLEIARDFMQTLGIIFANLFDNVAGSALIDGLKLVWGNMFNVVNLDFFSVNVDVAFACTIVSITLGCLGIFAWFWLVFQACKTKPDALRKGHETVSWRERAEKQHKLTVATTQTLTALLSAYVPVSNMCVEMLYCSEKTSNSFPEGFLNCSTGGITYLSIMFIVLFTLPFPLFLVYVIQVNKPRGSILDANVTYDVDGAEVDFDDRMYLERIESDPEQMLNPYRSLYHGFERRWAAYKVVQLVLKLVILLPAIMIASTVWRAVACTLILAVYCLFSLCMTPFVERYNDIADASGRLCAFFSSLGAIMIALTDSPGLGNFVGFFLNLFTAINLILLLFLMLWKNKFFNTKLRSAFGWFTFRDTTLRVEGPPNEILQKWDIQKEVKHRIWHHFWNGVLLNDCGADVAERNMELMVDARNYGLEKIKAHWEGESKPEIVDARMFARCELEGVDMLWNDEFGKAWISEYPYCLHFVQDASGTVDVLFKDEDVIRFNSLNTSPAVTERRHVRQQLRAMSRSGCMFEHPFSREEVIRVEDGQQGDENRPAFSEVRVTIHYTNCRVIVSTVDDSTPMSHGFEVCVCYGDGQGEVTLPRTGEIQRFSDRVARLPPEHIGLRSDFDPGPDIQDIFDRTESLWKRHLQEFLDESRTYRENLIAQAEVANATLSNAFWFLVYNDVSISKAKLVKYLEDEECNVVLKEIPVKHAAGLDFVYKRLEFCSAHPAWALWYVFFDELWASNGHLPVLAKLQSELSPTSGDFIGYAPRPREELETWLADRGLLGGHLNEFVSGITLDALYARMNSETRDLKE